MDNDLKPIHEQYPEVYTLEERPVISDTTFYAVLKKNFWKFIGQFILVFSGLVALFSAFGFIPEAFVPSFSWPSFNAPSMKSISAWFGGSDENEIKNDQSQNNQIFVPEPEEKFVINVKPQDIVKISIPDIEVEAPIMHPQTVNVATLDSALQQGAVYYPGSGTPASGNIFIFGHSTNWAVVRNQAYKTFNDLDKLQKGQRIILETAQADFIYEVDTVATASADDILVEFESSTPKLTVSTCNTFGQKEDRHVVEAYLVEVVTHEG